MSTTFAIQFTRSALNDIRRIESHIGEENPAAASRVAIQIVATCDRLEYLPERGRPGLVSGTRELVSCWPYVIVYRISCSSVEILRIWHSAQDR
ncbi:type II toxin-antitoxin system RelE/ParE family toxin [Acetobacter fabarum]|jgi:plasmid stabilization system protein ParE|uniref:type II toxin-antitoxin system RelE/ParE family toxin n=1 Tax=Acetobacteraceae TaxID=433 RepID=UPI00312B9558